MRPVTLLAAAVVPSQPSALPLASARHDTFTFSSILILEAESRRIIDQPHYPKNSFLFDLAVLVPPSLTSTSLHNTQPEHILIFSSVVLCCRI